MKQAQMQESGAEALAIFRQLVALTIGARSALEQDELTLLSSLLERREELIARATPLLQRLGNARRLAEGDSDAQEEMQRILAPILQSAGEMQDADAGLLALLASRRNDTAEELRKTDEALHARAAYAHSKPPTQMDFRR